MKVCLRFFDEYEMERRTLLFLSLPAFLKVEHFNDHID